MMPLQKHFIGPPDAQVPVYHADEVDAYLKQFEWQPIETAIKDRGVSILLAKAGEFSGEGYYGLYHDAWFLAGDDECAVDPVHPTHWMPLPAMPQVQV